MDLATMDDAQLEHALRLLLTEFVVRNALPQGECHDAIDMMFAMASQNMYAVEVFEHSASKEILPRLTEAGCAYALLTGRGDLRYRPRTAIEYDLLIRSTFSPLSPHKRSED